MPAISQSVSINMQNGAYNLCGLIKGILPSEFITPVQQEAIQIMFLCRQNTLFSQHPSTVY
jgi:hypothetical protein